MKIPLSEVIDRITILKLKIEHKEDPSFYEELKECENSIKEFESEGIGVRKEWFDELYKINKHQWGLESKNKEGKEGKLSLEELGKVYIELQISNKKRVAIKNKIAEETGSGFKDIKIN